MKCDRCGLQSDVEQAFSTNKRLLRKSKHFCPDCTVKRETREFVLGIVVLAGSGLLAFTFLPSSGIAILAWEATLVIFSMIPLIIIHELTHAGVAKLTGLPVFGIIVGIGKTIWSGKFLGLDWTINSVPIAGVTAIGPRPVPYIRLKLFLTYLAGPASHVFVAFGIFLLRFILPLPASGYRLFSLLLLTNLILAVLNLFPQKVSTVFGMQGSDGWHLLHVPFWTKSELKKRYVGYFAGEAIEAYRANDFSAAQKWLDQALALDSTPGIAHNILGMIQMAQREYRSSRATFLQVLESEEAKEPGLHYTLLNNIAYLDALLRDPCLLPEADQFSAEALKHLPWAPAVMGTRGTVLVELGKLDEGIALLKKSMALADKHGKALNGCHVAMGEFRRGNLEEARKYLASAKVLDPDCFLVPEVEIQIAGSDRVIAASGLQTEMMGHKP